MYSECEEAARSLPPRPGGLITSPYRPSKRGIFIPSPYSEGTKRDAISIFLERGGRTNGPPPLRMRACIVTNSIFRHIGFGTGKCFSTKLMTSNIETYAKRLENTLVEIESRRAGETSR